MLSLTSLPSPGLLCVQGLPGPSEGAVFLFALFFCFFLSCCLFVSACLLPIAHSMSPAPPAPPPPLGFQLETYLSEPQRLETRRLRSFSSPTDAALCCSSSSSSCTSSRSFAPPVGPGLQVGRLVSDVLTLVRLVPSDKCVKC